MKKDYLMNNTVLMALVLASVLASVLLAGCAKQSAGAGKNLSVNYTQQTATEVKIPVGDSLVVYNETNASAKCPSIFLPDYREIDLWSGEWIWLKYEYMDIIKFSDNYKLAVPVQLNCTRGSGASGASNEIYSCPDYKIIRIVVVNNSVVVPASYMNVDMKVSLYAYRNTTDPISGIPVKKAKAKLETADCKNVKAQKV